MSAPKAILFDAYGTLFDVYAIGALAEQLLPGTGEALASLWRDKQIEYTRLRTMCDQYADFWQVTGDSLDFSAAKLRVTLSADTREQLLSQYAKLPAHPDSLGALEKLTAKSLPLAILSNGTPKMLEAAVAAGGMSGIFSHLLSVDRVKKFKTAPEAYQLGPDVFGCTPQEIVFVSSNCWDACGAAWFGYNCFWVNRAGQPLEALGVTPAAEGRSLDDLVAWIEKGAI